MKYIIAALVALLSATAAQAQQPTNPKFPVFVFTGNPLYAAEYKATGADRFWDMWRVGRPLRTQLEQIRGAGMTVVGRDCAEPGRGEDTECLHDYLPEFADVIKGALGWDEPDAAVHQGVCLTPTQFNAQIATLRAAFPPGFPVGVNYSPGFFKPSWQGRGLCINFDKSYLATMLNLDFASADLYPAEPGTSLDAFRFLGDFLTLHYGMDRMRSYKRFAAAPTLYAPMQANDTDCGRLPIQQPSWDLLRAELWMGFIGGGQGPVIFYHCFIGNIANERRGLDLPNQVRRTRDVLASAQKLRDIALGSDVVTGFGLIDSIPADANVRCKTSLTRDRAVLVCVSGDQRTVNFRFSGSEGGQVCALEEGRRINPGAGNLYTDTFDATHHVHIYTPVRPGDPVGTCGDASARFADAAYDDTFR